jgi:hypothetical protein
MVTTIMSAGIHSAFNPVNTNSFGFVGKAADQLTSA